MIYGQYNIVKNCFDISIKDYVFMSNQPTLRLHEQEAQQLLQVLWDLGIRPKGREAEMTAVKLHLQDMRRLVFDDKA